MSATVPREMIAKTTLMISFILLHSCSQPNTNRGQSRVHQTHNPMQSTQHEPCWPGGSCCSCTVLLRFKWGNLAENVLWWSNASSILLSRGTTSTTPENMKELLKTTKQSHSPFPANKIPVRISVKLPFGAVPKRGFHTWCPFGLLLQVEDSGTCNAGVDLPPVPSSVYMTLKKSFNFSMAVQLQNKAFSAFGCLVCLDCKLFRAGTVSY